MSALQACYTGRDKVFPGPVCDSFDIEPDGDVDVDDASQVLTIMTGP